MAKAVSFLSNLCLAGVVSGLVACSTAQPLGHRNNPDAPPVPAASFKLKQAQVAWSDNPSVRLNYNYVTRRDYPQPPSEDYKKRVGDHVGKILSILQEKSPEALAARLDKAGVGRGAAYTIKLTPMSLYRDATGWGGSGAVVRVSIVDQSGTTLWTIDMDANSGIHWAGAALALPPDESYATDLAKGTVEAFRKAKLID